MDVLVEFCARYGASYCVLVASRTRRRTGPGREACLRGRGMVEFRGLSSSTLDSPLLRNFALHFNVLLVRRSS